MNVALFFEKRKYSVLEVYEVEALRIVVTVLYVIICVALVAVVIMQEGKTAGLGALSGSNENTYWGKNKGRSIEGKLALVTKVLAVLFIVISIVLNMNW